jgi:membrane-bound lytic murein transglycosylase B
MPLPCSAPQAIYGVPAEVIVAIIGVETVYGQNMGSFGVLEALASLAFHYPPRAEFFRGELEQFLLLARENGVSPLEIKGSYAGAIGIPQFMPSSQRRFAVDFDGDDRIDLRNSSIATPSAASPVSCSSMAGRRRSGCRTGKCHGDPAALLAAGIKPALTVQRDGRRGGGRSRRC